MATVRELIEDLGPAVPPAVAVAVARAILARMEDGPFDDVPPPPRPEEVVVIERGGALSVELRHRVDLAGLGALLYEMLAGGPVRRPKDSPDAPPRPLGRLREFMAGGPPLSAGLVVFIERLLGTHPEGPYPDVDAAIDALEALG